MDKINDCIYNTRKKQNKFSIITLFAWILFMLIANLLILLYLFKIEFEVGLCVLLLIFNIGIFYEGGIVLKDIYFFMTNQGFYFDPTTDLLTCKDIEAAIGLVEKIKEYRRNMTYAIITSKHLLIINFKPNIIVLSDIEKVTSKYQGKGILRLDITINKQIYTYFCNMDSINNVALSLLAKYENN